MYRESERLRVRDKLVNMGFTQSEANKIITDWFIVEGVINARPTPVGLAATQATFDWWRVEQYRRRV
jgi:hypothetical protein